MIQEMLKIRRTKEKGREERNEEKDEYKKEQNWQWRKSCKEKKLRRPEEKQGKRKRKKENGRIEKREGKGEKRKAIFLSIPVVCCGEKCRCLWF